jgi:hypothetical protein
MMQLFFLWKWMAGLYGRKEEEAKKKKKKKRGDCA